MLQRTFPAGFIAPCLPTKTDKLPPAGAGWLHEIKHDGFRMLVRRDAAGVRLFTRNADANPLREIANGRCDADESSEDGV